MVGCAGPAFRKNLKVALAYRAKHQLVFEDMSAGFPEVRLATWRRAVGAWEEDHSQPDPFAEPEEGMSR